MSSRWMWVLAAAVCGTTGAMAQEAATLKVGDKAPALSVEEWVKGKKIEKFESGKVYVVEFWATWCGPCIKGIPHLTEIQKEFKNKNVTVIGVASSERGADKASKLKGVESFVKQQGDKMTYTVAYDDDRSMSNAWMKPAGQNGIPCAFLVGADGKIAWIGHPMNGMDEQLKKAVAANKRTSSKTSSDSSRQVASSNDSKSDSSSSSQTSGSSSTSSSSDGKTSSSSGSKKSSSSGGEKKSSSGSDGDKKSDGGR